MLNVATPPTAVAVRVPESVPVPLARLTVNTSVTVASTTPSFRAWITGCVPSARPLIDPAGCVVTSNTRSETFREMSCSTPLPSQTTGPFLLTTAGCPLILKEISSPGSAPSSTPGVSESSLYTGMAAK